MKTKVFAAVIVVLAGLAYTLSSFSVDFDVSSSTQHLLEWQGRTTLDTRLGKITGLTNGNSHTFLGIRYGQAPVGERRFLEPIPAPAWQETYDATTFPNIAMQSQSSPIGDLSMFEMSEDSLFLNVFTPSTEGANRPVLFWIHGGSFTGGTANEYDGSTLAEQGDVVVVVINYRLGLLGFLDLSTYADEYAGSASNGIRDQILALQWVRDNIADYGGDRENVTLFGESAGGQSVLSILSAPSANGLYHKAIVHSGAMVDNTPPDSRQMLAEQLDVEPQDLLTTLRSLSADEMIALQEDSGFSNGGTIDGTVITRSSNAAILERADRGVPILAGSNRDEGSLFSYIVSSPLYGIVGEAVAASVMPEIETQQYLAELEAAYPDDSRKRRFERIWTELLRRGVTNSAVRASTAGPGGWLYRFDMPVQQGVNEDVGATHGAEIAFTFNNFAGGAPDSAFFFDRNDPDVRKLALDWSNSILQFAKTGDPNGSGLPFWPQYTADTRESLILDSENRIEGFLDAADRERWGDTETSSAELLQ